MLIRHHPTRLLLLHFYLVGLCALLWAPFAGATVSTDGLEVCGAPAESCWQPNADAIEVLSLEPLPYDAALQSNNISTCSGGSVSFQLSGSTPGGGLPSGLGTAFNGPSAGSNSATSAPVSGGSSQRGPPSQRVPPRSASREARKPQDGSEPLIEVWNRTMYRRYSRACVAGYGDGRFHPLQPLDGNEKPILFAVGPRAGALREAEFVAALWPEPGTAEKTDFTAPRISYIAPFRDLRL